MTLFSKLKAWFSKTPIKLKADLPWGALNPRHLQAEGSRLRCKLAEERELLDYLAEKVQPEVQAQEDEYACSFCIEKESL